jgi:hypothetical protein
MRFKDIKRRMLLVRQTDVMLSATHGLPGALGFLHLNDCLRRYPHTTQSPLHLLCIEWAAIAIMMHDMANIYWGKSSAADGMPENSFLRLSFDKDPVSAIVTLSDIIQEFERPSVVYGVQGNRSSQKVTLKYEKACSGTELEVDGDGALMVRYQMDTDKSRAMKQKDVHRIAHKYFDPQYGYLDMSSLGINKVQVSAI